MFKSKFLAAVMGGALLVSAVSVTSVQADPVEDAIKYRQAVFTAFRWHFGAMGAMVRGKADYDAAQFSHHAKQLAALTAMPLEGFVPGSDLGDTDAKSELFDNMEDVKARFAKLTEAANQLADASGGDLDSLKPLFGEVGKSCKGCHDNYREE